MDNLGAIVGPLLAIGAGRAGRLRTAILLSIIPGLLAVVAIVYAIRHTARPKERERQPIRLQVRPVMQGELGRLLGAVSRVRARQHRGDAADPARHRPARTGPLADDGRAARDRPLRPLQPGGDLMSVPAGRLADSRTPVRVLASGVGAFAVAYSASRSSAHRSPLLAACFVLAGVGIGAVETAEHSAVATLAPDDLRGSSFGALAAIQSFGNLDREPVAGSSTRPSRRPPRSCSRRQRWCSPARSFSAVPPPLTRESERRRGRSHLTGPLPHRTTSGSESAALVDRGEGKQAGR